jgi:excinuclease UvrABC nuclease subunit
MAAKHCLYRHYDSSGVLLYVGISLNAVLRLGQHRKGSEWFELITTITIEHFRSRRQAVKAERKAIRKERPKFNGLHAKSYAMTALQFRKSLAKLGISQRGLAKRVQVNDRTSRRWALGEQGVPNWVADYLKSLLNAS